MLKDKEKGIALLIVLMTVLIVVVLANVMFSMMNSHSRQTHHQISRIKAYYSDQAAMNLAIDKLRLGAPPAGTGWGAGTYSLCSSGCTVNDPAIAYPVNILITENPVGNFTISVTSNYIYTP